MTSNTTIGEGFASNYHARKRLLDYLKSQKAMAFVGAGASMELYKGWGDLLIFLSEEAKKRGFADDDDIEFWNMQQTARPQQVARMIRHKFGDDAVFFAVLKDYFQEKPSEHTGRLYTHIHQLIASLPFKGVVTTNYDPGLWNAFLDHRPKACSLLPATWQDKDVVNSWNSRDIFHDSNRCPILHIHGSWLHPDTIILDNDKYREVYGKDYFRTMFKSLWSQERLVLIGCGFNDTWLDRNLDEILGAVGETTDVRHVAFVGISEEHEKHMPRYRHLMQNMYRIEVLFYRMKTIFENGSRRSDHSDLLSVLNEICVEISPKKKLEERSVEEVVTQSPSDKSDIRSSFSLFNRDL
jgi:hypothetical protein